MGGIRWLLGLAAVTSVLFPAPVGGQSETRKLEVLEIDLWPEYDRPSTLVMYRFRLTPGARLSDPVVIPLPSGVGEPHAVAWKDDKGALLVAQFTRRKEKDRDVVLARLGSREGQLEFYTEIEIIDRRRTFEFVWPGGVDVGALSFQIQRPSGASGFRVSPDPSREWEGEDGLTYALVDLGPQAASATPRISVQYEKADRVLSAPAPAPAPVPAPAADSAPAAPKAEPIPGWAIGAGGAILGFLGAFLLYSRGRAKPPPPKSSEPKNATYCPECGTKSRPTDVFCMECGARLPRS
jgi:hypothetical protein